MVQGRTRYFEVEDVGNVHSTNLLGLPSRIEWSPTHSEDKRAGEIGTAVELDFSSKNQAREDFCSVV